MSSSAEFFAILGCLKPPISAQNRIGRIGPRQKWTEIGTKYEERKRPNTAASINTGQKPIEKKKKIKKHSDGEYAPNIVPVEALGAHPNCPHQ